MSAKKVSTVSLRLPQYRVLKALQPKNGKFPSLNRITLSQRAGFSKISGTVNRALHGIKKGADSANYGDVHKGLLDLGYVRTVTHDVDNVKETAYQATASGVKAAARFVKERAAVGRKVGTVRDAKTSTNARYTKGGARKGKPGKTKAAKKSAPKKTAKAAVKAKPAAKAVKAKAAPKAPKAKTAKPAVRKAVKRPTKKAQPSPATPDKVENPAVPVALPVAQPAPA